MELRASANDHLNRLRYKKC